MDRTGGHVPAIRIVLRWFVVLAVTAWSVTIVLPSFARIWSPLGTTGIYGTQDGRITSVDSGSPGARAGIQPGDRVDLRATDYESRRGAVSPPSPLKVYRLVIEHRGKTRVVNVRAAAEELSNWSKFGLALRTAAAIILSVSGAILLLLRPSLITWAFFFFLVGANPGSVGGFWALIPFRGALFENALENIALDIGAAGAMVFMILFPTGAPISRWSAALLRTTPWLLAAMVAMSVYGYVSGSLMQPYDQVTHADEIAHLLCAVLGIAAFLERYIRSVGVDRARIRWVGAALAVGLTGYLIAQTVETWVPGLMPYVFLSYLYSTLIVVPFAVMYAIIKHHVIDVRFFISRAIVYTVLTALIVLAFSLIDWFFSKRLAASGVGTGVEVLLAIGLGFSLNGLHGRIERSVDLILFRQRHESEQRLQRAARTIPHAPTTAALEQLLIATPYEALQLESAALFQQRENGEFQRQYAVNWPADLAVGADDLLVLHLRAGREPIRLREIGWRPNSLPEWNGKPVIAFPVFVRERLEAFALFGSHVNGADIDPDEERDLTQLAINAGAAYDHIDAAKVRAEMERMRAENIALHLQLS